MVVFSARMRGKERDQLREYGVPVNGKTQSKELLSCKELILNSTHNGKDLEF